MDIVCFEDDLVQRLHPATLARPAYAITCASLRLIDWLRQLPGDLTAEVRSYLSQIQHLDFQLQEPTRATSKVDRDLLLINARLVPRVGLLATLEKLACEKESVAIVDPEDGVMLAAKVTAGDRAKHSANEMKSLSELALNLPRSAMSLDAFRWPHDIVVWHMKEMTRSIEYRLTQAEYREIHPGVFVGENVSIGDYSSINTDDGPILLEDNVEVGPFCYLAGPVFAGRATRVIEHSALKDGVSLGHTVKIGGEVEASVIEPYSNKQHHGFLGHSYLGSWINLGAGTCNSDLKNTYGKINVEYGDRRVATGMQFFGCVMGDYSKTAINTGIFTGKVIGVCSMMYGFVTANVPSFVNYARLFGQTSALPADVMINTQQRMFARRKVQQRDCDRQLIEDMFNLTQDERDLGEQIGM